ncbi:YbaK/EbsC family protein [Candidatus Shapirobacteria bacterium]|nr:YbaK/EbsC family protein [Candidatus Shapirobacteria bacterium]
MMINKIRKLIESGQIKGEILEHPGQDGLTSEQAALAHGVNLDQIVKTLLFVDKKGNKAVVIIQGDKRVGSKKISGLKKPKIANFEELKEVLGCEPGGVPPVGLPEEILKLVDEAVVDLNFVIGSAGDRFSGLKLKPDIITSQPNTQVLDLKEGQDNCKILITRGAGVAKRNGL